MISSLRSGLNIMHHDGERRGMRVIQHNIHQVTTREKASTKPAIAEVDAREINQSGIIIHIAAIESKSDQLLKKLDNISAPLPVNNWQNYPLRTRTPYT